MYVEREITTHLEEVSSASKMIALVGARQAGKTTLLRELAKVHDSNYVMFDDPDARNMFDDDIKKFELQYCKDYKLIVLDEVQYCSEAGEKLKYLVDSGYGIWLTSSSETILGKNVLSYLVGRVSVLRLYPFSFAEFQQARGQKAVTDNILERNTWEHMTYGGYPQVVLTESSEMKQVLLKSLHETMLLKDVARTFSIDDIGALERCARYFAETVGGLVSYNNVSNILNISFPTLKKYIDVLEKSYLIVQVRPFYTNKIKEITKQPKIYFLDTGMRNAIVNRFDSTPQGNIFENYVCTELLKAGHIPKYWRTKSKAEVDFVLEYDNRIIPIEVKSGGGAGKITKSLRSFIDTYGPEKAFIVYHKGEKSKNNLNGCEIIHTSISGLIDALS